MESGLKAKLDYSDLLAAPDDGKRYEILGGDLYVTPAPGTLHQRISRRLERVLEDYFTSRGLGEMFHAPTDVILTDRDVAQPDIIVVADPRQVVARGIEGAPLLVVEILSPTTRERDRGVKARRYAELGIPHYWLVDPDARRIECFRSEAAGYRSVAVAEGDATLAHPAWDGLVIDLGTLWRARGAVPG